MRGRCAPTSSRRARSTRTERRITEPCPMATDVRFSLVVRELALGVRPVHLRLPFRFGAATLQACPQLFVRATVEVAGHGWADGFAAEMMVPKWFDKQPHLTQADNVAHLVRSCERAAQAYLDDDPATPFRLFARHYDSLMSDGKRDGATELSSAYGQAVL